MPTLLDVEAFYKLYSATYDPRDRIQEENYRPDDQCIGFEEGIVVDNKDPLGLGRVRVHFPRWGKDFIPDWAPIAVQYGSPDHGLFAIPDIGTRVECTFIDYNPELPVVTGCVYTQQHKAPISDNKGNDIKIFTDSSGNTILIDDKKGAERIETYIREGKMRMVVDEHRGIDLINELGDIGIYAEVVIIESEDVLEFNCEDGISLESESIEYVIDNNLEIKAENNVNFNASNITMQGNGVLAGNKPIALDKDQVVGIDKHNIEVPTPKGLQTVPFIPHPYIGKLCDKLSQNVKINNRATATKGSKSKNNTPMHLPMPPGVKFTKAPNNEGEVTSGTIPNVKVNGKEVAVLGSKVTTCNDPMPQEVCKIIAIGVAPKLPIEIPVTNPIDRSVINPKWDKAKATIGEKVKLMVQLRNQYNNATVEYKIYPEGADTKKDQPIQKLYGRHRDGSSEVEWDFKHIEDPSNPLKEKPKYFYTAESFGCPQVTAGMIEFCAEIDIECVDIFEVKLKKIDYTLENARDNGQADNDGLIQRKDTIPSERVKFKLE
jgi:uncharacterized Zn-binding protein involved in type VI secretion/phage baseplate assembly protein gpV